MEKLQGSNARIDSSNKLHHEFTNAAVTEKM
jgi:hypothetical protein